MTIVLLPLNFSNFIFLVWVGINRLRIRFFFTSHPFTLPFITGDAFRSLADHVYEEGRSFNPLEVQEKDIIFVSLACIEEYFERIHPFILSPYRLITHNGDTNIDKKFARYMDEKILIWWTQNLSFKHPRIKPIPIGIENLSYFNHGIPSLFTVPLVKKKIGILYGFSISTNPKIRRYVQKTLQNTPTAVSIGSRLNSREYMSLLRSYSFVVSPPGNGLDCHRTWEAIYVGVVPIVARSSFTDEFVRQHLPLWVIDDWKELETYTPRDLQRKYDSIMEKSVNTPLNFIYWQNKIMQA